MSQNPNIKYVRLNQGTNVPRKKGEFHHLYDGDVEVLYKEELLFPFREPLAGLIMTISPEQATTEISYYHAVLLVLWSTIYTPY